MGDRHTSVEKYSLSEHAQLRQTLHHNVLLEHQRQGRIFLPENFAGDASSASEWALDEYYFLQPVHARQRRAMLREAGVVRIDPAEREECRSLRMSRGRCGCSCREICRPPSCICCRSGIGCQVDQMAFPCSCSRSGCANPHGRVEFNAARVRAHFIRTLLQLGLEQSAAAEYDSTLPPPAKRCCIDDGQPQMSLSSSFSSSPSFFVSSPCVDSASVSAANGFEPQAVYLDSVEGLSGPDTMVVAYDEDYDEADYESSSETSSDGGASIDGVSDDVDDGKMAETLRDSRQRTLDDYIVRFSREQVYTDTGPSNCSTVGHQLGTTTNQSISAPLSCAVTCSSLPPQCQPTVRLRAETTHAVPLLHDNTYLYCMTSDTRHNSALPDENTESHSLPDTIISDNYLAAHDATHSTADNISSDYSLSDGNTAGYFTQQEASDTQCSASTVACGTPSSLTQRTTCICFAAANTEHSYDITCRCSTAENQSDCITSENSSQGLCVSNVTQSNFSQDNAAHGYSVADSDKYLFHEDVSYSCCIQDDGVQDSCKTAYDDCITADSTTDSDDTLRGNLVVENTRNDIQVSNDIVDGCDSAQNCSTPQETSHSSLHDNAQSYSICDDTVPCGYHVCTAPLDIVSNHSTSHDTGNNAHGHTTDNGVQNTTHCQSKQVDAKRKYFVREDLSHSCSMQYDTVHDICKTAHDYFMPYDSTHSNLVPDDETHGICIHDDTALGATMLNDTDISVITDDNIPMVSHRDNTGCTMLDDTDTSVITDDNIPMVSHTDNTGCTMLDDTDTSVITDDNIPTVSHTDNTGCTMPDDTDTSVITDDNIPTVSHTDNTVPDDTSTIRGHCPVSDTTTFSYLATDTDSVTRSYSMSENVTNDSNAVVVPDEPGRGLYSYSAPDDNKNSCSLQLSIRSGCFTPLKSDEIVVTAVGEECQPVQHDCGLSCLLRETRSEEVTTGNETASDVSETLDDACCVTGTASADLSEHSTLPETVARSQPSSVITLSSNHVNSVAESYESMKSDDVPATQDFSHIVACSAVCSFSDNETETPSSSLASVTDQLVAVDSLTSNACCLAGDLDYSCGVGNATLLLECPNDARSHEVKSTLDSVLAVSENT